MNKQERDEIRKKYTIKFPHGYQYSQAQTDVTALLDALDEMEKDRDGWKSRNENNIKILEEVIIERDRLQKRCEAFENSMELYPTCVTCKKINYLYAVDCCPYDDSCEWDFDEERFSD